MPDDLSSIEGLADKHMRALNPAAWQTAASFVVVFSQRRKDQIWERRVEAERTEVEPERAMQVWSGWNAAPVCAWIAGQLGQAIGDGGPPARAPRPAAARPQLRIDTAVLVDAAGRTDVVADGVSAARPRTELVAPVRVIFTVSGAPPQARLRAVTRIQHRDGAGWNPQAPVILSGPGQAEFDLARVPAGDHELTLIAWAPDATVRPVSVRLPRVTIRPEPG